MGLRQSTTQLVGQRFGRLIVLGYKGHQKWRHTKMLCRCDCGVETWVTLCHLRAEHTRSCGCLQREVAEREKLTHGHNRGRGRRTPEYCTWDSMIQRCENPNAPSWKWYGARGISVCAKWSASFEAFLEDMGLRPTNKHSIDRIDNNGNYEPGNCRWATQKEQIRNSRTAKLTAEKAAHIRSLKGQITSAELATLYSVTRASVQAVWRGRTWAD